ncbi:MAG: hypothetical protein ACK4MI_08445 [Brevundimonas sp.]|uniref:hypothetical protein n=1 Tax=Brevundimonas sp. TaxID=1871086 RepID=UPI0028D53CDC|nr:hypothetical protein [uncultured Brevundimonas sp.]
MALGHIVAAFLAVGMIGTSSGAQQANQDAQAAEVDAIEVVGSRQTIQRQAEEFVQEVGRAPDNAALARWGSKVCVGVVNLNSPYGRLVADRVSAVALDLGLNVGESGCRPNLMIIFASDAGDVARALVSHDRRGFMPDLPNSNLGDKALADFQTSERPVRWWHVSAAVELDTGAPIASSTSGDSTAPVVNVRQMSLLKTGIREDLQRVVIVVDANRVRPANLASVADFVAFIAMAQVDPDVDVDDKPSILSLFSGNPTTDSLTSWDIAYLRSLYRAAPDRRVLRQQGREIARTMVDGLLDAPSQP